MKPILLWILLQVKQDANRPSSTEAPADLKTLSGGFIAYVVIGVILILVNIPIIVSILRHAELRSRKEYLLLARLALTDMLCGLSTLIAGAYRLHLIADGTANNQMTRWQCAIRTPHFIVMAFSSIAQAGMLLLISIDRLIAVLKPFQYNTFTAKYALYLIGVCFALSALHPASLLVHIYFAENGSNSPTKDELCILNDHVDYMLQVDLRLLLTSLSVIIYIVVWILFRKHRTKMMENNPTQKDQLRRMQQHLSATVGICTFLTVAFYILPTALKYCGIDGTLWSPLYWILNCCNAVVNVYSLRHEEIRRGVMYLFTCKKLPSPAQLRLKRESFILSATAQAALLFVKVIGSPALPEIKPANILPRRYRSSTCTTVTSNSSV